MTEWQDKTSEEMSELAALYAAGALDESERQAFESQLLSGNEQAAQALEPLLALAEASLEATESIAPTQQMKKKLLAMAHQDRTKTLFTLETEKDATWEVISPDGIKRRILHHSDAKQTMLFDVPEGCTFPSHEHEGVEECYVISGELESNGVTLKPGDYQRFEAGSYHDDIASPKGCLLLITIDATGA